MKAIAHVDGLHRCPWPKEDPLYVSYHDNEWGVPEYDDRALFEKLILDGFQAGLSWITILRKRDNFRKAFDDFEPEKIARYTPRKVEKLMQDAGIVRNRLKIEGTILSARSYLDIMEKSDGFSDLLWSHMGGRPLVNEFKTTKSVPAETPLSRAISERPCRPGLQVRRPDHRLCLHAGCGDGQRSSGDVSLAQAACGYGGRPRQAIALRQPKHTTATPFPACTHARPSSPLGRNVIEALSATSIHGLRHRHRPSR